MKRALAAVLLVAGAGAAAWLFLTREAPQSVASSTGDRSPSASQEAPSVRGATPVTMPALHASSRVVYVAAPDRPHLLHATFADQRARLDLRLADGDPRAGTLIETRLGDRVARMAPGNGSWDVLRGAERDATLRRAELRGATLVFPDGFAWSAPREREDGRPGSVRTAELVSGIGRLEALCDPEGHAERVAVFTPDGVEQEALRIRTIQTIADRVWPRDMELEVAGVRVWAETLLVVQPNARFRDDFFAPTEAQPASGRAGDVARITVGAVAERRVPLPQDQRDWPSARRAAERLLEEAAAGGSAVESSVVIELDDAGSPVAALLRLRDPDARAAHFDRVREREALSDVVADGPPFVDALARLERAARESGARPAGRPYVRIVRLGSGGERFQIVWPIEATGAAE